MDTPPFARRDAAPVVPTRLVLVKCRISTELAATSSTSIGRYKGVTKTTIPGDLPREGRVTAHCQILHGAVQDPNPVYQGKRQRAAINIKTDALEYEYARGRISEAGYRCAQVYGRVLERSRVPGGGSSWSQGDRVDHVISHEVTILARIERATTAVDMIRETAPVLGVLGQRIFELVLVERMTIAAAAKRLHGSDDRQAVIYWSNLFRDSCELLVDHWCGRRHRAPRV